ncbi:MAG TPA: signal peptide peptidase SppA [Steroidobacteraceae bacterium]|jgi:protease-4|nr:signal peptide peptidase SppA [Steroidobacteraceae bacterium]
MLRSILLGLWHGLDFLRRFLHLLVLLAIAGFVFGALRGSVPRVPDQAALVIAPTGTLVEQLSGDALSRAVAQARGQGHDETLLWDLIDSIHAAAKDARIRVLVLNFDQMTAVAGQPTMAELAKAIREFKTSGKKVIAYGQAFDRDGYYLASLADEIYVDPLGYVLVDGYSRYRWYYKDILDKLNVDINIFRVGKYKSAVEEFTRTDMSAEDRQESLAYLNALWSSYQTAVDSARGLAAGAIANYAESLPQLAEAAKGAGAQIALKAHLVTGIKSATEVAHRISEITGADDDAGFHQVSAEDYARIVHGETGLTRHDRDRVAVIVAAGEILDGNQPSGTIGGDSTARLLRAARLDNKIRAVVLRVDSPGGSVTASETIYREMLALHAAGKPVVVSMANYAASGGYYISAPADEIWANPATITGSVGIFATLPNINRALAKVGVGVDGLGTTPLAGQLREDISALSVPLSEGTRKLLQATVDYGYSQFLEHVASGRRKTVAQVDDIAQGRVWAGVDAQANGLVDHLGYFDDAVKAAAARAHMTEYKVQFLEPELSWAQSLAMQVKVRGVQVLASTGLTDLTGLAPLGGLAPLVQSTPMARELVRLSHFNRPDRLYAYCFCTAQ